MCFYDHLSYSDQIWQSGNNLTRQSTSTVFAGLLRNTGYQFRVNAIYFGGRNISSNVIAAQTKGKIYNIKSRKLLRFCVYLFGFIIFNLLIEDIRA